MEWIDVYFGKYKWFRKYRGGKWYLHQFTIHAEQLTFSKGAVFWARYGKLNRYSNVISKEEYKP